MEKKAVSHRNGETVRPKAQVPRSDCLGNRDQQKMALTCSAAENQQGPHRPEIKSRKSVVSRPVPWISSYSHSYLNIFIFLGFTTPCGTETHKLIVTYPKSSTFVYSKPVTWLHIDNIW